MNGDYSLRSSSEMEELFIYAPKAYENTTKIASMIDLVIDHGGYKIPKFPLSLHERMEYDQFVQEKSGDPSGGFVLLSEEEWFLRKLCIDGLKFRYDIQLSDLEKKVCISKIDTKHPEKKLSDMSITELQELSQSHYPE